MTKECTKCKQQQPLTQFGKKSNSKDGLNFVCKPCLKEISRIAYENNKEKKKASATAYYERNKEQILAKRDPEVQKQKTKAWREANPDKVKTRKQIYKELNKQQISEYNKKYRKEHRAEINAQNRARKKSDPKYALRVMLAKRTMEVIKSRGYKSDTRFNKYVGCTKEVLYNHIEKQFVLGMTWENRGKVWEIDHIIPLTRARNLEQMLELAHYTNLQPLFAEDNRKKSDKMVKCWQKFKRDKNEAEDKAAGHNFHLSVSDFTLSFEPLTKEHRQFIQKYEWLGKIGYGVKWVFTARHNNHLAGVVMISEPNAYQFGEREALIQRGAVSSWAPKNLNSKLVMFACRWMVRNTNKRYFVAYSDPDAGEIGTIYQACNFDYLGQEFGAKYMYQLSDGSLKTSRYFDRTSAMKKYAKILGIEWQPEWTSKTGYQIYSMIPQELKDYAKAEMSKYKKVKQTPKGKYVLLLNYGKDICQKTWEPQPYPKREKGY